MKIDSINRTSFGIKCIRPEKWDKEVYDTLMNHFHSKNRTPLQHLRWDVDAMKAFTEAILSITPLIF